jgi:hypothetical protein
MNNYLIIETIFVPYSASVNFDTEHQRGISLIRTSKVNSDASNKKSAFGPAHQWRVLGIGLAVSACFAAVAERIWRERSTLLFYRLKAAAKGRGYWFARPMPLDNQGAKLSLFSQIATIKNLHLVEVYI